MTSTQLRDIIAELLPNWSVTINEQEMLNVQADDLESNIGFVYIEEMDSSTINSRTGWNLTTQHDVYFCRLGDIDTTAEQREEIRQTIIMPAVMIVVKHMTRKYRVVEFNQDKFPRGFDASEVLVHLQFQTSGNVC